MFRVASDRPDPYFSTGIPRRMGADAATELLPGGVSPRPGARFSDTESLVRRSVSYLLSDARYTRNPGIPRRTGSGCRYRNSCPASFAPARGTVFGYRYEKRCLFRFIRNISFSGSLRAARERMPLLKLLPGGVSPRPGTSGFFIPCLPADLVPPVVETGRR